MGCCPSSPKAHSRVDSVPLGMAKRLSSSRAETCVVSVPMGLGDGLPSPRADSSVDSAPTGMGNDLPSPTADSSVDSAPTGMGNDLPSPTADSSVDSAPTGMGNDLSLSRDKSSIDSVHIPPDNIATGNKPPANGGSFPPGVCGLVNLGVTEHISVALQLLSNCPPLTDYFLSNEWIKEVDESNPKARGIARAYASLVGSLWSGASSPVNPSHLRSITEAFHGEVTSDAYEFLAPFLDCLHQNLNRIRNPPPSPKAESESESSCSRLTKTDGIAALAQEACENYKERNDSIVSDLFTGFLTERTGCSCCENITCSFRTFDDIALPLPEKEGVKVDLTDCLRKFTEKEEFGTRWCENCMHKEPATQKLDIWKAPRIFIIHLLRCRINGGHKTKIKTHVNFPIRDLDLGPFILSNIKEKPIIYDLIGVINHESDTCDWGNYFAYCLNKTDGRWYDFDDERVTTCSEESVLVVSFYLH